MPPSSTYRLGLRLARLGVTVMVAAFDLVGHAAASTALPATAEAPARHLAPVGGTVVDSAGQPVPDVLVVVTELDRAVRTDGAGRFRFEDLPAGTYTLQVVGAGYEKHVEQITIPGASDLTVTVAVAAVPVEPIIVTATVGATSPLRSPLSAAVLAGEDLEHARSVSLARSVEGLPGLRTLSTGREIGKPVIRGLSGSRVRVLATGLPLEDYAWSDEDGPAIDVAVADRLEVVRGPASVLYGPDAVGGVVNVISPPLLEAVDGERVFRGDLELTAATNNRETDLVFEGEGAAGPWSGRLLLAGRRSEALHTPDGELENTGFATLNGEATVGRRGPWGSVTARYSRYGGEFKLLEEEGPPEGEEVEEGGPERKLSDDRVQLLGNFPLGDVRLETRVQGQRHHLIELEDDPEALAMGIFREVEIFDLVLSTAHGEALLHHSLAPGMTGTVGVTGDLQTSRGDGVIELVPDADLGSAGVFGVERMERGAFTWMAGLRADLRHVEATDEAKRTFSSVTWSLGGVWEAVPGLGLSLNVGAAWRAPTLFELFAEGPRLGEGRYEIGRSDLEEEHSTNVDVGLRWDGPTVRAHVGAFRNAFDHFLFIQPTDDFEDGYQVFRYDQADATLWGGEASLEVEASRVLLLGARADLVRGTNDGRDEPLPLMPPPRYTIRAELHEKWPSWVDRSHFEIEGEHVPEPTRLNPFDEPVGAHTLLHLGAGLESQLGGRHVALDIRVRNATNEAYRDFLSRYKRFALDPGRDIVIRLRMGL